MTDQALPSPSVPETFTGPVPSGQPAAAAPLAAATAPLKLSEVRAKFVRPQTIVPVYLDSALAAQIDQAEQALAKAIEYDKTTNEPDSAPAVAQHLSDLEDAAEASKALFTLRAIPHMAYRKLRTEHPPTAEQIEEASKLAGEPREPAFDPDGFSAALVKAQLISPVIDSDEEFDGFWEDLNDGTLNTLWQNALDIQLGVTDPGPKSESASKILQSFGSS